MVFYCWLCGISPIFPPVWLRNPIPGNHRLPLHYPGGAGNCRSGDGLMFPILKALWQPCNIMQYLDSNIFWILYIYIDTYVYKYAYAYIAIHYLYIYIYTGIYVCINVYQWWPLIIMFKKYLCIFVFFFCVYLLVRFFTFFKLETTPRAKIISHRSGSARGTRQSLHVGVGALSDAAWSWVTPLAAMSFRRKTQTRRSQSVWKMWRTSQSGLWFGTWILFFHMYVWE